MSWLSMPFRWVECHGAGVALVIWLAGLLVLIGTTALHLLVLLGYAPGVDFTLLDFGFSLILAFGQFVLLTFGVLIIARRPRHPIGWLLCGVGLLNTVQWLGFAYESFAGTRSLPLLTWVVWFASLPDLMSLLVLLMIVPYLFPDGRLISRRWSPLLAVGVTVIVVNLLHAAFAPPMIGNEPSQANANPTYVAAVSNVIDSLESLGVVAVPLALIGGVVSLAVRYRRARGIERLQIRWLLWVLGLIIALTLAYLLAEIVSRSESTTQGNWTLPEIILGVGVLLGISTGIPAVLGLAILRYRLYSIDLIINRTIVYAVLTLGLGAIYATSVVLSQRVLNPLTGSSDIAIAGSTLLVAVLFQPLRRRIQGIVDRHFYRTKYDAERIIQGYSITVRQEVDLDRLQAELIQVVTESLQPQSISVWIREHSEG